MVKTGDWHKQTNPAKNNVEKPQHKEEGGLIESVETLPGKTLIFAQYPADLLTATVEQKIPVKIAEIPGGFKVQTKDDFASKFCKLVRSMYVKDGKRYVRVKE